jgi:hypothetical protein
MLPAQLRHSLLPQQFRGANGFMETIDNSKPQEIQLSLGTDR